MKQPWYCEKCRESGSVPIQEGHGVYSVVEAIRTAHGVADPQCAGEHGLNFVRVPRNDKGAL